MSRLLRVLGVLFVVYLIARFAFGTNASFNDTLTDYSFLILLAALVYTTYVIIKQSRKNSIPASRRTWFYRVIGLIALLYLFRAPFLLMSAGFFLYMDKLLQISDDVPPAVMWAVLGASIGLIVGSFVVRKKYNLSYRINLIPIGVFLLLIFILVVANEPFASKTTSNEIPSVEVNTESNISASSKKFIVNRWVVVDVRGRNQENFQRKNNENSILEFKKNGKCYLSENGVRKLIVFYTLSADGRSILFNNPNNSAENRQMHIISITKDELIIRSELFQNDTAILRSR